MNNFYGTTMVWWYGIVEDVNDPLKLGRCRVRVYGYHTSDKTQSGIPTEHLPWATVIQPITSAAMSGIGTSPTGILPGTFVVGFFADGNNAQMPIVFGTIAGIPSKAALSSLGFSDPSGKYPLPDLLNEPDVNRLARNDKIEDTIVFDKKSTVETNIPCALQEASWDEPETPYSATYPKNHVIASEAGHVFEIDDTPGSERLHEYHKSGTFEEIHPDGSKVVKVVGKNFQIVYDSDNVFIKGKANVTVSGQTTVYIQNDAKIQVDGNCDIYTTGDLTKQVDGDYTLYVGGNYTSLVEGESVSESNGNMRFDAPRIDINP